MATSLTLTDGVRTGTATQAGTYTFNTKDKYNNANIAFTIPAAKTSTSCSGAISTMTHSSSSGTITVTASGSVSANGSVSTKGWVDSISGSSNTFSKTYSFTDTNLTAANIKLGTKIFGITGTLDYISTQTSVPTSKVTSIIKVGSTYYLWR